MGKKTKPTPGGAAADVQVVTPPAWFRVLRWSFFAATVGIAIGMLALIDQRLSGIPWVYDGQLQQYVGREVKIQYCMFSAGTDYSIESRCSFAMAIAAVSLALSFVWSYLQTMRRNPFKHPKAKLADVVLCLVWALLWLATAIILCVWADQANKAGSFLSGAKDARNGLCVMAWLEFLLVAVLTCTAGLLYSKKCQATFDKWEAKSKQHHIEHEQKRLQKEQAKVAQHEAAAAAAKESAARDAAAKQAGATPAQPTTAPAGRTAAPAAAGPGPAADGATGVVRDVELGQGGRTGVPVSTTTGA